MDLKLIETILAIIIMVFLGYGMRRSGLLKYEDAKSLNKIVVNLAIPSLIFMALYRIDISVIPSLIPIPINMYFNRCYFWFNSIFLGKNERIL